MINGYNFGFSTLPPLDNALHQRLEQYAGEMSYTVALKKIKNANIESHIGLPQTFTPADIPHRRALTERAVKNAIAEINKVSRLQYSIERDAPQVQVSGPVSIHTVKTRLYITMPQEPVATTSVIPVATAPVQVNDEQSPMEKIKQLKGLLDAGAITAEEFELKKAELLARI